MFYSIIALSVLLLLLTYLFQWYYRAFNEAALKHNKLLHDFKKLVKAHDVMVGKYNEVATVHNTLLKELREHGVVL